MALGLAFFATHGDDFRPKKAIMNGSTNQTGNTIDRGITANDDALERRFCGVLVALIWALSIVIVFAI